MTPELQEILANLPPSPGVYQFFDKTGDILYVGKAKILKNRVRSYFQKNIPSARIGIMVQKIHDLQFIVTHSEVEALVLENNLIKEKMPRYNVNLKDDKTYPYIKITKEMFPQIYPTRTVERDGSKYFGPYTDVKSMRSALRLINKLFKIRSCKLAITSESIEKKKHQVCLDFHIKKCDGPCEGLISESEYGAMVKQVSKLLSGRVEELLRDIKSEMASAAERMEFEKAAVLRDRFSQLQSLSERQKIITNDESDRDIIAIAHEGNDATAALFIVRNGKLIGKKNLRLKTGSTDDVPQLYSSVIQQYYSNEMVELPHELIVEIEPDDMELIEEWLTLTAGYKVKLHVPQKGILKQLISMCKENALLQLKEIQLQKMKKEGNLPYPVDALRRDLRLKSPPRTIECFDISHIQGTDTVASLVVFVDGKPKKSEYRKFIIRSEQVSAGNPDDFISMEEVVKRRYSKFKQENKSLPDLIMVDGGKGQLSSAVDVLRELEFKEFTIIGLAKRLEEVYFPGKSDPEIIPKVSSGLKLLQQVRDEAHRFAVTFHKLRRSKRTISTELTQIQGVGKNLAEKLLKEIGSVEAIKQASLEALTACVGQKKGLVVYEFFRKQDMDSSS